MPNPTASKSPPMPATAVIGVSALFPGSLETDGFWRNILEGRDQIRDVPPEHWLIEDYYHPDPTVPDKTYGKRGAFLDSIPFDPIEHKMPPNAIQQTDTSQLLGMIVAQKVLDDATEQSFKHIDKSRISVILGATGTTELVVHLGSRLQRPIWLKALRENGIAEDEAQIICDQIANTYVPWTEASFPGLLGNVIAGRIANRFDLGGTNCVVDAACASSLSALSMGLSELYRGQSDMVITGGVDTLNDILMYMCFSKTPALSPTGDCRPFAEQADGTILGEGLGLVALRRLEDAERDGDHIYAVIRGLGASSDGTDTAIYAPKSSGQANALRRAYEEAGYSPRTVELLEAHGTATKAGDLAEFQGASSVFAEADPTDTQWCAIGSIKSQIGHTKGAAGAASLIKAVLALHHKVLPPTIKVDRPNPNLAVESSPFYINTEARPWIRDSGHPRRASVSSFGFGGSNFHITLEEYTGNGAQKDRYRPSPTELFLLGTESIEDLVVLSNSLTVDFESTEAGFQFLARETQTNFQHNAPFRLAVVAKDFPDLKAKLTAATTAMGQEPDQAQQSPLGWYYSGHKAAKSTTEADKIAFLFPGQGSQYVGMGADLAQAFAAVRQVWDEAADLEFEADKKLHEVVFPIPVFSDEERAAQETTLRATQWAQPAIGVASLGHLTLLTKLGLTPDCVGGHSFGEVTALYAAGALDQAAFLAVARKRGALMAEAAETLPAAMTAVFHDADQIKQWLAEWAIDAVIANHNSPQQVVISGQTAAIHAAEAQFEAQGVRFQRLPVSTAFHSPIVSPATEPFESFLDQIDVARPKQPVYANSSAAPYPAEPGAIRETLANQIAQPVHFAEQIDAMVEAGVRTFIEVGPGSVLSNLVANCLGALPHRAIALDRKGQHGLTSLWHAIAELVMAGAPMQLASLWDGVNCGPDPRSRTKPKLAINISGVNYDKPYPPEGGSAALPAPNPVHEALPTLSTNHNHHNGHDNNGYPKSPTQTNNFPDKPLLKTKTKPANLSTPPKPMMNDVTPMTTNGHTPAAVPTTNPATQPQTTPATYTSPETQAQPVQPSQPGSESSQWVGAFQELQRQTVDAHMAFLRVAEQSMKSLEAMVTGQPTSPTPAPEVNQLAPPALPGLPVSLPQSSVIPKTESSPPARATMPSPPMVQPVTDVAPPLPVTDNHPADIASLPAADAVDSPSPTQNLHVIMLDVVSEKTGYPTEMLEPALSLSADLGIDSIKRVEILAAMQERVPDLPDFEPSDMAALNTLQEIVSYMDSQLGSAAPSSPPTAVAVESRNTPASAVSAQNLHVIMLGVVSEKTGYPTEMLEPDMSLSADLGIDSIKRVEILAAMQERVPDLPDFEPSDMAALNTLQEIVSYMDQSLGGAPAAEATRTPDPVVASEGIPSHVPTTADPLGRYVLATTPQPAPGLAPPFLIDGTPVQIIDDGRGVAAALADQLNQAGAQATVRTTPSAEARSVICLTALSDVGTPQEAARLSAEAFGMAAAIAPAFEAEGGLFVTVQDTGGDHNLITKSGSRAWLGGFSGLAKTATQEWPKAVVRSIDIAQTATSADGTVQPLAPREIATRLAAELLNGGTELEIGLPADGQRLGFSSVAAEIDNEARLPAVDAQSVIVVSGGGRGVTAATIIALARQTQASFALLGRTVLEEEPAFLRDSHDDAAVKKALLIQAQSNGETLTPKALSQTANRIFAMREIRGTLDALTEAGSQARYIACDVTDSAVTAAALQEVRAAWGPITGIVHGAGVLADKRLAEKNPEDFQRVFDTKVLGLHALLSATQDDPLSLLCLFSSVAGRVGNAGQADYAMANEVLNRVAQAEAQRRGPDCLVKSIGWGPWEGGMVTPLLKAKFEEMGVTLISIDAGAQCFVNEVQQATASEIDVVIGGGTPQTGPLLGSQPPTELSPFVYDLIISAESHPYLESHRINDTVVLPLVLVQEWFLRAASGLTGQPFQGVCHNLRVLKGVPLPDFATETSRFRIQLQPDTDQTESLQAMLYDQDGVPRYSATLLPADSLSSSNDAVPTPLADWQTLSWHGEDLYGRKLFHGPDFAALQAVNRLGDSGAEAMLSGSQALAWTANQATTWATDPALIDGGLQLARIWGLERLQQLTLPTAIEKFVLHQPGLFNPDNEPERRVRCLLQGQIIGQAGTRCNLWFVDEANGTLLAEIQGLEMYVSSETPIVGGAS